MESTPVACFYSHIAHLQPHSHLFSLSPRTPCRHYSSPGILRRHCLLLPLTAGTHRLQSPSCSQHAGPNCPCCWPEFSCAPVLQGNSAPASLVPQPGKPNLCERRARSNRPLTPHGANSFSSRSGTVCAVCHQTNYRVPTCHRFAFPVIGPGPNAG